MPDPESHPPPPPPPPPGCLRRAALGALKVAAALLVALLLTEGAMRVLGLRLPPRTGSEPTGVLQRVPESVAPGVVTALRPGAHGTTVYPGAGETPDRVVEYRINSAGLRDRLYAEPKPPGVFRIAVIGDSVTYGTGIDLADTASKALERHLVEALPGRVEVLNCGVPATNTGQQVAHFVWRVLPFEPDLVLVCTTVVDASGCGVPVRADEPEPWEIRVVKALGLTSGVYTDEHETPAQRRTMALRRVSVLADFVCHHAYRVLYRRVQLANYARDWQEGSPGVELIRRSLERLVAQGEEHGFEVRVMMYPFLTSLGGGYPFAAETKRLQALCAELGEDGVVFYDLLEPLRGQDPTRLQAHLHDRHPNGKANELVGRWLAEKLLPDVREALAERGR